MLSLTLGAVYFIGLHLGIAGTSLRGRAIAALGEGLYRGVFAAASAAGMIWLVMAYKHAPEIVTWGHPEWWKPVAIVLMLPAFLLAVMGLAAPNPAALGQESLAARPAEGITRVTRHPLLLGVGLWALIHLIANGDAASLIFFGAFAVTALAGTVSIDAKRRRRRGAAWDSFAAQTSVIPFAAIAARRNRFKPGEIAPWRWAAAIIAYALLLGGHSHIFGVSPFPG
jgi:uncharacterized membrane protein